MAPLVRVLWRVQYGVPTLSPGVPMGNHDKMTFFNNAIFQLPYLFNGFKLLNSVFGSS